MRRPNASIQCLLANLASPQPFALSPPNKVTPNCSWTIFCSWQGEDVSGYPRFMGPKNQLWHIFSLSFSSCHMPQVIFHLLGNRTTSLHQKGAKSGLLNYRPISKVYYYNPSPESMRDPSFSLKDSSQITNLHLDKVTRPWTCCFNSPNNGWRPTM